MTEYKITNIKIGSYEPDEKFYYETVCYQTKQRIGYNYYLRIRVKEANEWVAGSEDILLDILHENIQKIIYTTERNSEWSVLDILKIMYKGGEVILTTDEEIWSTKFKEFYDKYMY